MDFVGLHDLYFESSPGVTTVRPAEVAPDAFAPRVFTPSEEAILSKVATPIHSSEISLETLSPRVFSPASEPSLSHVLSTLPFLPLETLLSPRLEGNGAGAATPSLISSSGALPLTLRLLSPKRIEGSGENDVPPDVAKVFLFVLDARALNLSLLGPQILPGSGTGEPPTPPTPLPERGPLPSSGGGGGGSGGVLVDPFYEYCDWDEETDTYVCDDDIPLFPITPWESVPKPLPRALPPKKVKPEQPFKPRRRAEIAIVATRRKNALPKPMKLPPPFVPNPWWTNPKHLSTMAQVFKFFHWLWKD